MPYFHCTNSSVFTMLPHTNFHLSDVFSLLKQNIAPINGEIGGGGLNTVNSTGTIAFAEFCNVEKYNLESTFTEYALRPICTKKVSIDELNSWYDKTYIYNIMVTTVKLMRSKQLNLFPNGIVTEKLFNLFQSKLQEQLINFKKELGLCYIICKFFTKGDTDAFYSVREELLKIIPDNILEHHTETELAKIAEDLYVIILTNPWHKELPELKKIQIYQETGSSDDLNITEKQINKIYFDVDSVIMYPQFTYISTLYYQLDSCNKRNIEIPKKIFAHMLDEFRKVINLVSEKVNLFLKVLSDDFKAIDVSKDRFVLDPFPVIFYMESEKILEEVVLKECKYEYRSQRPLMLGKDLNIIAIPENQIKNIREYFITHGINNMSIISIEELMLKRKIELINLEEVKVRNDVYDLAKKEYNNILLTFRNYINVNSTNIGDSVNYTAPYCSRFNNLILK